MASERIALTSIASLNSETDLEGLISELKEGSHGLNRMSLSDKADLIDACAANIPRVSKSWVELACEAKQISNEGPITSEEILVGPASLLRYLRLLSKTLRDVARFGRPQLPSKPKQNTLGRTCVPILPVRNLHDSLVFMGLKADIWLQPGAPIEFSNLNSNDQTNVRVAGILGAGNVAAIPATDMLYKIFHDHETVLLKLNPVNDYIESVFDQIFRPLIDLSLLRMIRGGSEVGKAIVDHSEISSLHITGSHLTHDMIVWGADLEERQLRMDRQEPLVNKPITSELGNVTPWIIVPGKYSSAQLKSQAEHVAASITNNASFNCLATKMLVTSKDWPQRKEFLDLLDSSLEKTPARVAYYPGAHQRFEKATGKARPDCKGNTLPWTLIRDASLTDSPHLFKEESFTCVCAETAIKAEDDLAFLKQAVEFVNQNLFGTLCASVTIPDGFQKKHTTELESAIADLRYGSVSINQWSGVVYGLMTPPWGGHPSSTIASPESGIGHVHNTFCLKSVEKTVLWGPLVNFPKPVWFSSHKTANRVGWSLLRLYERPSLFRLPSLFYHALRG